MTDGLDLSTVVIHNSPDVRDWPATATITRLEFRPTGVHVEHTKNLGAGAWPTFVPNGWDGPLQYTLWIVVRIAGTWHAAGCIQFWQACDQNGGPPEEFAKNWYYAADRWAPMTSHQPVLGESVGFLVTAGDARNNGQQTVQERSQVVVMPFPRSGDVWTVSAPVPEPPAPPGPAPTPEPGPAPPDLPMATLGAILSIQHSIQAQLDAMQAVVGAIQAQLARGFTNRYAGDITPKPPEP